MLTAEFLQAIPLLHDLQISHLRQLASLAVLQHYNANTTIFQENSLHRTFYLVTHGTVALDLHLPRRSPKRILTVGTGDILAWSAVLADGRMTTSAITLEPAQVVAWPAGQLLNLCEADHEIGFLFMQRIAQALSRRLTATRLQLLDMYAEIEPRS